MADTAPLAISLHTVQIVNLSQETIDACLQRPIHAEKLSNQEAWKDFPEWMGEYNSISSTYRRSFCHRLGNVDASAIERALREAIPWMSEHCEGVTAFKSHVFYEPQLHQWLILHQLDFTTNLADPSLSLVKIRPEQRRTKADFYNEIRDFFVISDDIYNKSDLILSLEDEGRSLIKSALEQLYGLEVDDPNIIIPDSAGNMTLFALSGNQSPTSPAFSSIEGYLVSAHECAERIGSSASGQTVPDIPLYIFWGRFHTVMANDCAAVGRIMPIHFQAQLMWAYLSATDKCIQEVESAILSKKAFSGDGASAFIDALVNSMQYAHFMNERFRRSIEGDAELIYRNIEKRWHIDTSLSQNREFAEFLSGHIEQNLQQQSLKSEGRQNKVLSIIAILGFLSLIDTWSSFLEMADGSYDQALQDGTALAALFNSSTLAMFNFGFSMVVTVLCIAAVIYFLTRK